MRRTIVEIVLRARLEKVIQCEPGPHLVDFHLGDPQGKLTASQESPKPSPMKATRPFLPED